MISTGDKKLCPVIVTVSVMKTPEKHELVMLAKDDSEIQDKVERWARNTRKGSHVISWEAALGHRERHPKS